MLVLLFMPSVIHRGINRTTLIIGGVGSLFSQNEGHGEIKMTPW